MVAACASEGETAGSPATAPPVQAPPPVDGQPTTTIEVTSIDVEPGVLVWIHDREPPDLHADDPENPTEIAGWIQQGLVEGLFGVDSSNAYYPELLAAEPTVEQLNSGTIVITYQLRSGLTWSDGTPLTSADVAYTYDVIVEGCEVENDRSIVDATNTGCEYDLANRFGYELITDFDVVDDTTFAVTLAAFYGGWRDLFDRVFAAHAFGETARDVNANLRRWESGGAALPSSGPLTFRSWEPGVAIELGANDRYHGSASPDATSEGPVSVTGVEVAFVADLETRIELLLAGEAHLIMTAPDPALVALAADDRFTVASSMGPTYEHWGLNLLNPHLAKPEVREAIAFAIDKAAVVTELYQPLFGDRLDPAGLGNTFWVPNQAPYVDHQRSYAGTDAAGAASALVDAGYERGSDGIWTHPTDGRLSLRAGTTGGVALRDAQLDLVAAQLADVGIEVTIDSEPGGLFFTSGPFAEDALAASGSGGSDGDPDLWDIAQFSWTTGPWPGVVSGIYRSASESNPYGFDNPEYDVAATDCNATFDDAERAACYNDLDRFATTLDEGEDGLFIIPLTQRPRFFGWSAPVAAGAVAPDLAAGGPLVNAVDYRLAE